MRQVRRTSAVFVTAVLAVGFALGALVRPLFARLGESAPRPGWLAAGLLVVLAAAIGLAAWNAWRTLHHDKQTMASQLAMTLLALAKSCVVVGALFSGAYAGFATSFVRDWQTAYGQDRVVQGAGAALASVLVLVAALFLERALHMPQDDDEDDTPAGGAPTPA